MRSGALDIRHFVLAPVVDHQLRVDLNPVQQHGAAGGGALTEAGPVIDDLQAGGAAFDEAEHRAAVLVDGLDCDPVGEQRAGGIELLAADPVVVAVAHQLRADVEGVAGVALGAGVADAPAAQHTAEQHALLRIAGDGVDHVEDAELVLRNLPERTVGLRDTGDDLGQGDVGYAGTAEGFGHADGPQAGAGEQLEFGQRQAALAVAQGAVAAQLLGDVFGDGQGLGVVGDDSDCHGVLRGPLCGPSRAYPLPQVK
ncbi:hypothetical protein D9M73_165540 [compost metagenome]